MARIPLLSGENLTEAQQRVYDAVVSGPRGKVQGPMMAALHRPELADKWQQLGEILRYRTSLPPRLSELAILVTARRRDCQLEWLFHEQHAINAGLEPVAIDDIRAGRRPELDDEAQAIHDFAAEMHDTNKVSDATHAAVTERWGIVGVVELTALIGYYTMVAMTLNAHEFPLPDGTVPPLPDLNQQAAE